MTIYPPVEGAFTAYVQSADERIKGLRNRICS